MPDLPHAYGFDPTYGYTPDTLLKVGPPPAPPADFETFWRTTYDETIATSLAIEQSPLPSPHGAFHVRLIRFTGWQGVRLGGWLIEPAGAAAERFVVVGHGYYNRPFEDLSYDAGVAALFFGCRGLGVSRTAGIPDETARHVLHGIDAKETYVHRGCVADTWSAASAMLALFPHAAGRLEYRGDSFGGGIGAMALAWDQRFAFAKLGVPSFGHHPIRLTCECVGSGEAVRQKFLRRPEVYDETLRYFDAATHAARVATPTFFACAAFDPAVPPPGQFAIHNAVPGPKRLCVLTSGHHDWAGTDDELQRARDEADRFRQDVR